MKRANMIFSLGLLGALMVTGLSAAEEARPTVAEQQVIELPVPSDPTVSLRIWFRVGSQNDPPGKEGLAALTAAMLAEGATERRGYEEILDRLFPLAGWYWADVSMEMTILAGRVHRDNLEEYYPLFVEALVEPAFRQEDLDRLRGETLNYLENTLRYASDEDLAKAALYQAIFAGTPYGHIPEGTINAVRSITLDDIRGFYRRHYTASNVVLGIGGSYDQTTLARLRQDLARLPSSAVEPVAKPSPGAIQGHRVVMIEKDAPATAISMGFPIDVLRGTRDWYALAIANSWFGEHRNSSSHLYQVLREARGLNYGDYSYIEHFPGGSRLQLPPQNVARRQQIFEIWIRPVPHEARHFALRAAVRELRALVEQGLTQEQFDLTRKFLRNYVLHYAPTTMERLGYALDDRFHGIEEGHLERFRRMMDELTLEEVNAAIRQHLQWKDVQIAVVTQDAASLRVALATDAPSPYTYPTPKPPAVLAEDREISVFPLKIPAENITIVPVEEFLKE